MLVHKEMEWGWVYVCILPREFLVIVNTFLKGVYNQSYLGALETLHIKDSWSKCFCSINNFCLLHLQLIISKVYSVFSRVFSVLSLFGKVQYSRSLHDAKQRKEFGALVSAKVNISPKCSSNAAGQGLEPGHGFIIVRIYPWAVPEKRPPLGLRLAEKWNQTQSPEATN